VDPESHEMIELGTQTYPYKSLRSVFSEINNQFAHSDSNLFINIKEGTKVFLEDDINFLINITSVTIQSYSDSSEEPLRATIVATKFEQASQSKKTAFNILAHSDIDLDKSVSSGSLSSYEKALIGSTTVTITLVRGSLYINNIDAVRDVIDRDYSAIFIFSIYLQTSWLSIGKIFK
jgi:hypothetical protein